MPPLKLQPLAMQRLLTNLIDNALRHGGDEVEVETAADGGRVRVSVLDRGPGIPPADAERMLQPFTRLNEARSTAARDWGSRSSTASRNCTAAACSCSRAAAAGSKRGSNFQRYCQSLSG